MKENITIGMDLGDKRNFIVVMDETGEEIQMANIANKKIALTDYFTSYKGATVAIEAGTHSPWISRLLEELGCHVFVGNPRKLRLIWDSKDKSDERDARILAMICRLEPRFLWPIHHRNQKAQADLSVIKSRDMLVKSRTSLINHARGLAKTIGERLPKCSAACFAKRAAKSAPHELQPALEPVFEMIEKLSEQIKQMDRKIEQLSENYPETVCLRQVPGVGPITSLAFVLTLEDHHRFKKSRQVGAFLGLTPRRDQSGETDKQLRITKAGNQYVRQLLVSCSQYIMGPFAPDSDLRRHGQRIAARGGKNAKRRAVVAVARKLSVLLHRLWCGQESYRALNVSPVRKAA